MEYVLQRLPAIGDAIPGALSVNGSHVAFTLERVPVAIPAGRYAILLYNSPRFGRSMPWLQVPGRDFVLIHHGNYPKNSDGCILVGRTQDSRTGNVWNSQIAFDELCPIIQAAVRTEECWITVVDPLNDHEQVQDAATGEA